MRKLYDEFFYIPEGGKISEKVILTRVTTIVVTVILCLAAMGFAAYASFSYNISAGSHVIKAARFETNVSLQVIDENGEAIDIEPTTSTYQMHKVRLEAGKFYTVTITPTEKSTAKTGFVIITAGGCEKEYHTRQLGVDTSTSTGKTESVSFELMVTDQTEVCFLAHWGTSSYYDLYKNEAEQEELYITEGEEVKMIVNGYEEPNLGGASAEGFGDENEEQPSAPAEDLEA